MPEMVPSTALPLRIVSKSVGAARDICHLTSAISGGAQSARRLLIPTCPRQGLSLQAA
jgi:hypothetical protein